MQFIECERILLTDEMPVIIPVYRDNGIEKTVLNSVIKDIDEMIDFIYEEIVNVSESSLNRIFDIMAQCNFNSLLRESYYPFFDKHGTSNPFVMSLFCRRTFKIEGG